MQPIVIQALSTGTAVGIFVPVGVVVCCASFCFVCCLVCCIVFRRVPRFVKAPPTQQPEKASFDGVLFPDPDCRKGDTPPLLHYVRRYVEIESRAKRLKTGEVNRTIHLFELSTLDEHVGESPPVADAAKVEDEVVVEEIAEDEDGEEEGDGEDSGDGNDSEGGEEEEGEGVVEEAEEEIEVESSDDDDDDDDDRLVVVFQHGLAEHSGLYIHVAHELRMIHNVDFYSFDMRGHGESEGRKYWVDDFAEYAEDLAHMIRKRIPKGRRVILLGHSLGSTVILHLARGGLNGYTDEQTGTKYPGLKELFPDHRIVGICSTGTTCQVYENGGCVAVMGSKMMGGLYPSLPVLKNQRVQTHTTWAPFQNLLATDKFRFNGYFKALFGKKVIEGMFVANEACGRLDLPCAFYHAKDDHDVKSSGSIYAHGAAPAADDVKDLKLFEECGHGLFFEEFWKDVVGRMKTTWVDKVL